MMAFVGRDYDTWVRVFVVLAHASLIPIFFATNALERPRIYAVFLFFPVALFIFDILWLTRDNVGIKDYTPRPDKGVNPRVAVAVLSLAVASGVFFGRSIVTYTVFALYFMLLLLLSIERTSPTVILTLTALGSISLALTQTLTVFFFAETGDTIRHIDRMLKLMSADSLSGLAETRYANFPMFHIFLGTWVDLTGLNSRLGAAILSALVSQLAVLGTYIFLRNVSGDGFTSLIASILLSISVPFFDYATSVHPQMLSTVFFVLFLVLLFSRRQGVRWVVMSALIIVVWVLTHHLSVFMGLVLTGGIIVYLMFRKLHYHQSTNLFNGRKYVLGLLVLLSYWTVATDTFKLPIYWMFRWSPAATGGTSGGDSGIGLTMDTIASQILPIMLNRGYYPFMMAFIGVGLVIFARRFNLRRPGNQIVLIAFAVSSVFYLPNPMWLILEGVATLKRWWVMTLPLVLFFPALGISDITNEFRVTDLRLKQSIYVSIIFIFILVTISVGMTNPSLAGMAGYNEGSQKYVSQSGDAAIRFSAMYSDAPLFTPYPLVNYGRWYVEVPSPLKLSGQPQRHKMLTTFANGTVAVRNGFIIIPVYGLNSYGLTTRMVTPDRIGYRHDVYPADFEIESQIVSRAYSNGKVVVYRVNKDG